jgi:ACS family D-galactonate transporter-like MFS transporter
MRQRSVRAIREMGIDMRNSVQLSVRELIMQAGFVILVSIAGFCAYASGVSAYATAIRMGGKRVAPVFATMNMAGNIGAGVFPFAGCLLVVQTGNWNLTLLLFAGLFAGSAVCWAFLNPKGTLFEEAEGNDDHSR